METKCYRLRLSLGENRSKCTRSLWVHLNSLGEPIAIMEKPSGLLWTVLEILLLLLPPQPLGTPELPGGAEMSMGVLVTELLTNIQLPDLLLELQLLVRLVLQTPHDIIHQQQLLTFAAGVVGGLVWGDGSQCMSP